MNRRGFLGRLGLFATTGIVLIPISLSAKRAPKIPYMSVDLMKADEFYAVHDAITGEKIDREFVICDAANGWGEVFAHDEHGRPRINATGDGIVHEIIYGNFEIRPMRVFA